MKGNLPRLSVRPRQEGSPDWFRFSLPLPEGEALPTDAWSLRLAGATDGIALQARPLVSWADGSVRWLELQGLADRSGTAELHREVGDAPPVPAWIRETEGGIELGTGDLTIRLAAEGASPVEWIRQGGEIVTAVPAMSAVAAVEGHPVAAFSPGGRSTRVREWGPVRVEGEVSGGLVTEKGVRLFDFRLRAAVLAGSSQVMLRLLVTHALPGVPVHNVRELRLALHWQTEAAARHHVFQPNHTLLCRPREIVTEVPVELRATTAHARVHVADTSVFGEEEGWPLFMPDIADHTEPFLGLALEKGWVTAAPRDFREMCPKALTVGDESLALHLHPAWAEPLSWLQGRSREVGLDLLFTPGEAPPETPLLRRLAERGRDGCVVRLPAEWYATRKCWGAELMLPAEPPTSRRFHRYLRKLGTLPTILGMWELGDTIDMGYTRTYAANHSTRPLSGTSHPWFRSGNHTPLTEWSGSLTHEPVWANNEYDAILALVREVMRDAPSLEHWERLRWFARHAIEVDFVAYSDSELLHHGTPAHSADHQRATAYPSHLWAEGLLAWYCLSGDDDALQVAVDQGDFILRALSQQQRRACFWGFSRELGWALLHLAALTDITREKRFHDGMLELARALTAHPLDEALLTQMVQGAFGYASIALGVQATWAVTHEAALADWLVQTAEGVGRLVLEGGVESVVPEMILLYFTTAWQVSGSSGHLRPGMHILEQMLESLAFIAPTLEGKPVAMLHRGLGTWLGPAWRSGLLEGLDFRHYPAGSPAL